MESPPVTHVPGFHTEDCKYMPYRELGETGLKVSALSYGASALGSMYRPTSEEESFKVVEHAVKSGINYIDAAPWYGHGKAETVLGKILPSLPRSSFYMTTKVCRYMPEADKMFDFRAERVIQSVDESLARLNLEYIDIIQVHDMEFAPSLDIVINETLPALEKVRQAGKAKFIGITGYPLENFKTVLERSKVKIDTVLTYCRGSMNDNALKNWIPYFKERGVGVVNASPISMGLLSDRGPPKWHPAKDNIKEACAEAAKYCQSKGVDISRLGLRFTLDQEDYPTTLVSTASLENLKKNLDVLREPLTDHEKTVLSEVMDKYMTPLNNDHWEGVEVAKYRNKLANLSKV